MPKGFSLCSHIIATAHTNGDLKVFLNKVNGQCKPNLTSIANYGMPSGTCRKGGVAKQKRKCKLPGIESRSVRPCLGTNEEAVIAATSAPNTGYEQIDGPTLPPNRFLLLSSSTLHDASSITLPHSMPSSLQSVLSGTYVPSVTSFSVVNDFRPHISTVNASSHGQVCFGTNISSSSAQTADLNSKKPLI